MVKNDGKYIGRQKKSMKTMNLMFLTLILGLSCIVNAEKELDVTSSPEPGIGKYFTRFIFFL